MYCNYMDRKLKVAIICHVSNRMIRNHLALKSFVLKNTIKRIIGRSPFAYSDYGTWNTISLKEYGKYSDSLETHAIVPHPGMKDEFISFKDNNIYYHCFCQSSNNRDDYVVNRTRISTILHRICPDLICIVGIEAPFYALSALDIDVDEIPVVVCMQTAMSDPDFIKFYPIGKKIYEKMLLSERSVIKHARYIASDVEWHRELARRINPSANYVRYYFCTDTSIKINNTEKEYDFVYWASNIEKAGMDALKAFSMAYKGREKLTLNLVGAYTKEFYERMMNEVKREGLERNVFFSGYFSSHEEALKQVQKSRFALVPIKIDIISSTIREAAMMRMPIVTFITKGTPSMNREKQCVLLSDIGDYQNMANNMLKLIDNPALCDMLAENAYEFAMNSFNNELGAKTNIDMFRAVFDHFHNGLSFPADIKNASF